MATSQYAEEVGCWKRENVLGTGGFGYVVLWRNKETNDTIALKECRWGHDPAMTPKHRNRWKLEVDMMSRLDHPNVVTAIPVPPELDVPPTELPLLAMEYCSNGDLRKLLSKPENCCGLKEKHVRLIMRHVSSAINYLHSMRIIHRDLKPENIVIQSQNENVVYKLIDLGYAKELDQGSLCTSFVGTLQYLAPELFMSQKYSCTVDYWSLGLVAHEVITGSRPFLPDKSPAEWIPIIRQKNFDQIRAYLDEDKNIVFSSEIAPCYYISDTFKQDVEEWLQLMLDWNPKKRGRKGDVTFFSLLETILNKKVAVVFCVETLKLYNLIVTDGMSYQDFCVQLEMKTGIPVAQQELFLSNGHFPDTRKGAEQFVCNLEEEEQVTYLFDLKNTSSLPLPSSATYISPSVEAMMRKPLETVDYLQQRSVWAEAVHLCQQECIRTSRVSNAFKAYVTNLVAKNSSAHKSVSRMTAEMNKLMAKCSFLKRGLELDIKYYKKQYKRGGFSSPQMIEDWERTHENLQKIELLKQKVINVEACYSNISSHAVHLHKSPLARTKLIAPIEETYKKVLDSISNLRKRSKEQRRIPHDNTDFVRCLCLCLQHNHAQTQELLTHIRKVKQVKQDIDESSPLIINLSLEMSEWDAQIDGWQSQRQREIWALVDTLCNKIKQSDGAKSPSPVCGSPQIRPESSDQAVFRRCSPDPGQRYILETRKLTSLSNISPPVIIPPPNQRSLSQCSNHSKEDSSIQRLSQSSMSISGSMPLSFILDETSKDNQRVKQENQELVEKFQSMMELLLSYKDSDTTETLK